MSSRVLRLGAMALIALSWCGQGAWSAPRDRKEREAAPAEWAHAEAITARAAAILDTAQARNDFDAANESLTALLDQVIAYAPAGHDEAFVTVAEARRLVDHLEPLDKTERIELLGYLRANPKLLRAIVFLRQPIDDPDDVYGVLNRLRTARGAHLNDFANLGAAICVVHDQPLTRRINENNTAAPDPVAIFDYFVSNERRMAFGVRDVPAELLVYVVDTTASIQEMQWALERYHGNLAIGDRFFEIEYDYDHFLKGRAKKVTEAGYSLTNILQFGGVCADQAYYAMSVGKALGVPTTYTVGRSSEVSHAWVGFLESAGRNVWWNFNSGRYEAYQNVRGSVLDPQTRRAVDDSAIGLLADLSMTPARSRIAAAALTDAATRLQVLAQKQSPLEPAPLAEGESIARRADKDSMLELLEQALRQCPGYAPAWKRVQRLADEGELTLADKRKWAAALHRLCGERYPDFYLDVLGPMIRTIEDPRDQDALWNAAHRSFARRLDLAAEVRFEQGRMWEAHGEPARAGRCYEDVIDRLANGGPFVLEAIQRAEQLLASSRRPQLILALYKKAWKNIDRPGPAAAMFFKQSNWYKVGALYAQRLRQAGMGREGDEVESRIVAEERSRAAR